MLNKHVLKRPACIYSPSSGVSLTKQNESESEVFLSSKYWNVHVRAIEGRTCAGTRPNMAPRFEGDTQRRFSVKSEQECRAACLKQQDCMGWSLKATNCQLLSGWYDLVPDNSSVFGKCSQKPSFTVTSTDG